MWLDFINTHVVPATHTVFGMICSQTAVSKETWNKALNELKGSLSSLETHLRLRNFVVGHSLTLADVLLVCTLATCFEYLFDKKTRDGQLSNLNRYASIILEMPGFASTIGHVKFCEEAKTAKIEN